MRKLIILILLTVAIVSCARKPYVPIYSDIENTKNNEFTNQVQTNLNELSGKMSEDELLMILDDSNKLKIVIDYYADRSNNPYVNKIQSIKDKYPENIMIKNYFEQLDFGITSYLNEGNEIEAKKLLDQSINSLRELIDD